jgi:hypothetical protein
MLVIVARSDLPGDGRTPAEKDGGRRPALGPVATVRPLEVVEAQPRLEVGVDRLDAGVVAIAEGDPVLEV